MRAGLAVISLDPDDYLDADDLVEAAVEWLEFNRDAPLISRAAVAVIVLTDGELRPEQGQEITHGQLAEGVGCALSEVEQIIAAINERDELAAELAGK